MKWNGLFTSPHHVASNFVLFCLVLIRIPLSRGSIVYALPFKFEKNAHVLLVVIAFSLFFFIRNHAPNISIRNLLSNTIYRVFFYKKLDLPTPQKLRNWDGYLQIFKKPFL